MISGMSVVGELAGIMLQLIGVIVLLMAGYVFLEGAIRSIPAAGWAMAAVLAGLAIWPLVAVFSRAIDPQNPQPPTLFAEVGGWFWLGCLAAAPLVGLVCLVMRRRRLWKAAVGIVAGKLILTAGYLSMLLATRT